MLLSHLCWNKIWVVEGGNTIVTPLLKQNMDCLGWRCYCHTSVETKYGLLRVTIQLSHLCWNKIGIVEGDNAIVIPLMKQNICCLGWKCYCRTCWNKIWIVTPLLNQNMDYLWWRYYCHTSVELLSRVRMLLSHLCWIKIWVDESGNTIITPLLNQNMGCLGWQCYCHTSVESKYGLSRVTMLLSHLCWIKICCLGWQCYCHTTAKSKCGFSRVMILLSHLCWIKIWVV